MADAKTLFVLLECAAGYALFEVVAFEEIGALLEGSMDTVVDLQRFGRAVKLKAFQPFESAQDALENVNAISEHAMTGSLHNFLEMNLPKITKKSSASFSLGVIDPALATAISDGLSGISCRSDDTVREILRGCRLHLDTFVKGLEGGAAEKAQLGLGHSYSRSKVKFNPARSDNMIIQSIALLDQMDKDLNTFAMRVKEWYSFHFPELKDIVKDNYMFARSAAFIQDKASLFQEGQESKLEGLEEIVGDEEIVKAIVAAARTSMGMDCSAVDMVNIINFTQRMVKLAEYRKQLALYLTEKMSLVAPNLSALLGDTVAARLISKAGSLTNLAKAPASTVQILGAEKALFRALKTKGNTPKYGLIYHSTFIGRADAKNKGRISRYLANKCSIATRIDSFSDEPTRLYGEKLRDQVEERLKFYETGAAPRKNVDVMEQVAREIAAGKPDVEMEDAPETPKSKKKKKKDKKRKAEEVEESPEDDEAAKKASKKATKKAKKETAKTPEDSKPEKASKSSEKSKKKKKKKKSKD
jgi:nucleolar protein 56